jgi:hypothetical protein
VSEWVWVGESWSCEQVVEVTVMMGFACVSGDGRGYSDDGLCDW